jgi:general secretion pathway protein J
MRRARGFTLVEVMVALAVMAMMSLMAWQGVSGIVRTREISEEALERTLRLETVVAQWEQDLASLQATPEVPPLLCDGQSVRLTRRTETGLQVVVWSLRPTDDGALGWQRWASPSVQTRDTLQETWLRTQQFQGIEEGQVRALAGLDEWQVYFYRGNAWSNCQSTGDAAGAVTTAGVASTGLPTGVRIVLSFRPGGGSGSGGKLVRDVLLEP